MILRGGFDYLLTCKNEWRVFIFEPRIINRKLKQRNYNYFRRHNFCVDYTIRFSYLMFRLSAIISYPHLLLAALLTTATVKRD